MAFGDVGGPIIELIITCCTKLEGGNGITKGDAVSLIGPYQVTNEFKSGDPIFGQAMSDGICEDDSIPIKVRGIAVFDFTGPPPRVDGVSGITASSTPGSVRSIVIPAADPAISVGKNLKMEFGPSTIHVLL